MTRRPPGVSRATASRIRRILYSGLLRRGRASKSTLATNSNCAVGPPGRLDGSGFGDGASSAAVPSDSFGTCLAGLGGWGMSPRPLIGPGLGSPGGSAAFGGEDGASAAAALVGASPAGLSYLGGGRMNPRPLAGLGFGPPRGLDASGRGDAPIPPVVLLEISGRRLPVPGCEGVNPCFRTGFALGRLRFRLPESLPPNRAHNSKIGIRATLAQRHTRRMMSTASILYSPLRPLFSLPVPSRPNLSCRLPILPIPNKFHGGR